jgi:hypothetical protein
MVGRRQGAAPVSVSLTVKNSGQKRASSPERDLPMAVPDLYRG